MTRYYRYWTARPGQPINPPPGWVVAGTDGAIRPFGGVVIILRWAGEGEPE